MRRRFSLYLGYFLECDGVYEELMEDMECSDANLQQRSARVFILSSSKLFLGIVNTSFTVLSRSLER